MAWSSPLKIKRNRYQNEYRRKFLAISLKYNLGLTYQEINENAFAIADIKAKKDLTWYQGIVSGDAWNLIGSIFMLVFAVVISVMSLGQAAILSFEMLVAAFSIVAAVAGFAAKRENLGNDGKMPKANLTQGKNMSEKTLNKKVAGDFDKEILDKLPMATKAEFADFLTKISQKNYKNTPKILKIATLNDDLNNLVNSKKNANVFITRARAGHISVQRKGAYGQALRMDEQLQIPSVINAVKTAYEGGGSGFIIAFKDTQDAAKINLIVLDSIENGNFIITAKKIKREIFEDGTYKEISRGGS